MKTRAESTAEQVEPERTEPTPAQEEPRPVLTAAQGAGPLLQRDYYAVIEGSDYTPQQVMQMIVEDFPRFSPEELACFSRCPDAEGPLSVDEQMTVAIKAAGSCDVRIVRVDEQSITMRTLEGHPEAGRITFGAYYDDDGQLVFRIRSRARAGNRMQYIGYKLFGKAMQTRVWAAFIERVVEACEGRLRTRVRRETTEVTDRLTDQLGLDTPTFVAGAANAKTVPLNI